MIVFRNLGLVAAIAAGCALQLPPRANAFDLSGAWAASEAQCAKVFTRKGRANQVGFTSFPGAHGGGFIAEAGRLKGKRDSCKIKSRKENGQTINLVTACASDIMLSDVQFVLKVIDDNTLSREFPGMEGLEVKYFRCRIQ
jgi:hypothetical protein